MPAGSFAPGGSAARRTIVTLPEISYVAEEEPDDQFVPVNAVQVRYEPMSRVNPTGAVIASSMAAPTRRALEALVERVGDIDEWLCLRLEWTREELATYLTSEQIDGVALALDAADRGEGLIIGDMTGFGKGRIVAATARALILRGRPVIFMTEKANLFSDFWRDVRDIGSEDLFGRPLMLNDGVKLVDTSTEDAAVLVRSWKKTELDAIIASGRLPAECRLVMATYSQFNRKGTRKSEFLSKIAPGTHIVLDEAHNFVGDSTTSKIVGEALELSSSSTFSSATFARDVTNLSAYSSVFPWLKKIPDLDEMTPVQRRAIAEESVRLATQSGRIIRREHDTSEVVLTIKEDDARLERNEILADRLAPILSGMAKLARKVDRALNDNNSSNEEERALMLSADEKKAARENWFAANFGSRLNSVISQFVVALLVDAAVDECVASLRAGEKPVVVIASTMEALMRELSRELEGADIADDDEPSLPGLLGEDDGEAAPAGMRPPTFREALNIMCDRMLKVGVRCGAASEKFAVAIREPAAVKRDIEALKALAKTMPAKEFEQRSLVLQLEERMASSEMVAMQRQILDVIQHFPDLSLSPIDDIRNSIEAEGRRRFEESELRKPWVADEISARSTRVTDGRYVSMPAQDRNRSVARYVNGGSQALVITRAASTGLSIHDSDKFMDHGRRHMIELDPPSNVIERIQTWGRVLRRGQRTVPRFTSLSTGLPFQIYKQAMQNKKVEEVAASVTGSGRNGTTLKIDDPVDSLGNAVAHEFLTENQEVAETMGIGLEVDMEEANKEFYFVSKLLKRLPLLRIEEQKKIFSAFMAAYLDRKRSSTAHASRELEGQWEPVKREVFEAGDGSADPLNGSDVYVTTLRSYRNAAPMGARDVQEQVREAIKRMGESRFAQHIQAMRDNRRDILTAALPKRRHGTVEEALRDVNDNSVKRANQKLISLAGLLNRLAPGISARLPDDDGEPTEAVIIDIKAPDFARAHIAREYEIVYALLGDEKPRTVKADTLIRDNRLSLGDAEMAARLLPKFDTAPRGRVEVLRKVLDGNGLRAVLASRRIGCGSRTNYLDHRGKTQHVVLLPKAVENRLAGLPGRTNQVNVALAVAQAGGKIESNPLHPEDGIALVPGMNGSVVIKLPSAKRAGKQWETEEMLAITGPFDDGYRAREAKVPVNKLPAVLSVLGKLNTEFHFEARFRTLAVDKARGMTPANVAPSRSPAQQARAM